MATFDSVQYAEQGSGGVDNAFWEGRVRVAQGRWVGAPGLAQNDVVRMAKIPAGARVIGGFIRNDAFGTGVNVRIGVTADGQEIHDGSVATAGRAVFVSKEPSTVYSEEKTLYVTFKDADPSDTATLDLGVFYVKP